MRNTKHIIIVLLLLSILAINAKAQSIDAIDQDYNKCKIEHNTAPGMSQCAYVAYGKWDSEMNRNYQRILKLLKKPADKSLFTTAQNSWKTFRDAEFAAYNSMFNRPGDKWTILRLESRINIVRVRTLQLYQYYDSLKNISKELSKK
ncbi:MAG: DUF1311 domain-containing protein [Taibaiella sp.]|nr:DUF1311 domain-containing protein [Taibaiella sp.]